MSLHFKSESRIERQKNWKSFQFKNITLANNHGQQFPWNLTINLFEPILKSTVLSFPSFSFMAKETLDGSYENEISVISEIVKKKTYWLYV